jgi:hypothetical protein
LNPPITLRSSEGESSELFLQFRLKELHGTNGRHFMEVRFYT